MKNAFTGHEYSQAAKAALSGLTFDPTSDDADAFAAKVGKLCAAVAANASRGPRDVRFDEVEEALMGTLDDKYRLALAEHSLPTGAATRPYAATADDEPTLIAAMFARFGDIHKVRRRVASSSRTSAHKGKGKHKATYVVDEPPDQIVQLAQLMHRGFTQTEQQAQDNGVRYADMNRRMDNLTALVQQGRQGSAAPATATASGAAPPAGAPQPFKGSAGNPTLEQLAAGHSELQTHVLSLGGKVDSLVDAMQAAPSGLERRYPAKSSGRPRGVLCARHLRGFFGSVGRWGKFIR